MLNKFLLLLLIPILLLAQDITPPAADTNTQSSVVSVLEKDKIPNSKYGIEYFSFKDLSTDTYWVSIVSDKPDEVIDELRGDKEKKIRIQIGEVRTDIIKDSVLADNDSKNVVNFLVNAYYPIGQGRLQVKLLSHFQDSPEVIESALTVIVPPLNDGLDKQPFIESVSPEGGARGDTITLRGRNFGKDIDQINISLYESTQYTNGEDGFKEIAEKRPFYISQTQDQKFEVKFNLPLHRDLMKGAGLRKSLKVRMFVSGRPSNFVSLTLLPPAWKWYSGLIGITITVLFLISLYWILRRLIKTQQEKEMQGKNGIKRPSMAHFVELLLADRATNTYSLSKFQALIWTIAAIGSYSYVIISQGLVLRNGKVPDFNPSLIILMSISYGGLIAANSFGAKKPKNEVKVKPPQWSNLFCEGGSVDLSRLQLFGFTIVAVAAYIYNLALGNPLEGLPDIPPTLLSLMGVSQGGYLGNKAVGKDITINDLSPKKIEVNQSSIPITMLGSGFVKDMKVLIEEYPSPIVTELKSPSELTFLLPKLNKEVGHRIYITLQPPSGVQVLSNVYIQLVDVGQGDIIVEAKEELPPTDPILDPVTKPEIEVNKEEDTTKG
ncbi:MAG: IPT/TIG domain-containing protein [Leptospiraceae bacterium]|nr:IPT/TIG domain-containing protein [Leptospiraceae bacterium]